MLGFAFSFAFGFALVFALGFALGFAIGFAFDFALDVLLGFAHGFALRHVRSSKLPAGCDAFLPMMVIFHATLFCFGRSQMGLARDISRRTGKFHSRFKRVLLRISYSHPTEPSSALLYIMLL